MEQMDQEKEGETKKEDKDEEDKKEDKEEEEEEKEREGADGSVAAGLTGASLRDRNGRNPFDVFHEGDDEDGGGATTGSGGPKKVHVMGGR